MRVGVDARSLGRAEVGPGIYARELIGRLSLAAPRWEFLLYTGRPDAGVLLPGGQNVRLRPLGLPAGRRIGNLIFEQVLLPAALSRDACDLLWSPAFVLPLRRPTPQVVTMHDAIPLLFEKGTSLPRRLIYNRLLRINARRADRILTVSESSARDLHRLLGVDRKAIRVIPNGRDERFTPLTDSEAPQLRVLLTRLEIEAPYLLFTAGLLPRKNVHTLVDAFARAALRDRAGELRTLVLTGKTDHGGNQVYVRGLERRSADLGVAGRVRFVGFRRREELRLLYGGALACVDPSLYEGFGFPVIEAMACGCPVIASNRSSLPEVAGEAALLVDPDSTDALTAAIEQIAGSADLRARLRARGLQRVRRFGWEESARRTLDVFCEVLGVDRPQGRIAA
jgi:glycosyltransferase involved in cell wall biosynthesis